MNIIGKKVIHAKEGQGVITAFFRFEKSLSTGETDGFRVKFENGAVRVYRFPNAFQTPFLSTEDTELLELIKTKTSTQP